MDLNVFIFSLLWILIGGMVFFAFGDYLPDIDKRWKAIILASVIFGPLFLVGWTIDEILIKFKHLIK